MGLEQMRNEIDHIDAKLLEMLNSRAALALKIGDEKRLQNLAVLNPSREEYIHSRLTELNRGPLSDDAVEEIFKMIIEKCRDLQS